MNDQRIAARVLQYIYDERYGFNGGERPPRFIAQKLGLEETVTRRAALLLADMKLATLERNDLSRPEQLRITTAGICTIEGDSLLTANKNAPQVINNTTVNTSTEHGDANVVVGDGVINHPSENIIKF